MASASAASRVNVRDVLRVKAVESYVRNFAGESHRLQELLEVTLSYGIYCVSRNFQLKGMTVDELRTVTKHDQTKTQDFYVRNAAKPPSRRPGLIGASDPQQLYVKASHSWRDGDNKPDTPATADPTPIQKSAVTSEPEVFFLPNEAHKDKLDEIDFYTRVLGKAFVDVGWATYSSRGSTLLDSQQLQERMTRVDQRKRPDLIPQTELPVCSFVDFLNAYVKTSVAKISTLADAAVGEEQGADSFAKVSLAAGDSAQPRTRAASISMRRDLDAERGEARTPTSRPRTMPPTPRDGGTRTTTRPNAFDNVQSKIKPELQAHKDKLLRVKKTQTQLMKESLARARLDEYAAKRGDTAGSKSALPIKRMPLAKITPGAAALEIVDDFIRSPLMDKFTGEAPTAHQPSARGTLRDPLKEELYGKAAHDDSFLGCKAPTPRPTSAGRKSAPSKSTRDYSGWLGDFGPQHTKTVRPVWDTDATGEYDDAHSDKSSEGENNRDTPNCQRMEPTGRRDRFEWKFDVLTDPHGQARGSKSRARRKPVARSLHEEDDEDSLSASDAWSTPSNASDPVYRWLKTAV